MELSQILGWIATTLFTAMYIPQIYRTWKTKKVDDVSLIMFITGFIANIDALCYATLIKQAPLQFKYSAALALIGAYLIVYFTVKARYGK